MNRRLLKSTKLFEKIEVEWFSEDDLRRRTPEYRPFYREVVGTLLQKMQEIREFVTKSGNKKSRRQKRRKSITAKKMKGG
jgi:hypothetical protein